MHQAILFSVFIVASCGLAYELIAAALASYVLGDSVLQFSTVIGTYLFAMGVGSWLAKYIDRNLPARFVQIELLVGLVGGLSGVILFVLFAHLAEPFRIALYFLVFVTGTLVGLEIPLIMRILKQQLAFKDVVSQVLSVDYLGALAISILFPIWFVPHMGLMRTSLVFGILNVLIGLWAIRILFPLLVEKRYLVIQGMTALGILVAALIFSDKLTTHAEQTVYADKIIYADSSPYQRVVLTRWRDDMRLFLNGNLQFSSRDEYRYHEALVHPVMSALPTARNVLVLGGGDGLAVREVLKYKQVEKIVLVDLDAKMTHLFSNNPMLTRLNENALKDPRVHVVNDDALKWLEQGQQVFDAIIIDFPDPSNHAIGKLYSTIFYRLIEKHLSVTGLMVVQSTSPMFARQSFWCVVATLKDVGFDTTPYHAYVPSFGEWGFIIAGRGNYQPPKEYKIPTKFITPQTMEAMLIFPADMAQLPVEVNRPNNQVLVRYFEQEWRRVMR